MTNNEKHGIKNNRYISQQKKHQFQGGEMEQTIGGFTKKELFLIKFAFVVVTCFIIVGFLHFAYERYFSIYEIVKISQYNVTQVQCGHKLTGFQIAPNGQLLMTQRPMRESETLDEYKVEFSKKGETKNLPNVYFEKQCK